MSGLTEETRFLKERVVRELARHRQDACATSFTSEMEILYVEVEGRNPVSIGRDRVVLG
jgi:hypothetical protein